MEENIFNSNNHLMYIYTIESQIKQNYDILSELEVQNKKETKEYQISKANLKKLIHHEKVFFSKLDINKARTLLKKLNTYSYFVFEDYINTIYYPKDVNIINSRISYKLDSIINNSLNNQVSEIVYENDDYVLDEFENEDFFEDFEDFEDFELDNYEQEEESALTKFEKGLVYIDNLQEAVEHDIINTILKLLNDYIENNKYKDIKPYLTKYKYLMAYIFPYLEQTFIKNNFNISKDLYWGSALIVDLYREDEQLLDSMKAEYADNLIYIQLSNLLDLMDKAINNNEKYAKAISFQIIIRSCMLFADEYTIDHFLSITKESLKTINISNKVVEDVINNSFNKLEIDQQLPLKLSLKPPKN